MFRNITIFALLVLLVGCGTAPSAQTIALPTLAPTIEMSTDVALPTHTPMPDTVAATSTVQMVSMISTLPPTFTPTPTLNFYATQTQQVIELERKSMDLQNQRLIMTLTAVPMELTPSPIPSTTPIPVLNMPLTTYYTLDPSRMRPCPYINDNNCPNIVEIPRGRSLTVSGETDGDSFRSSDNWYRVTYNGQTGFVHASLLSMNPPTATPRPPTPIPPTPEPAPQQQVNNGSSGNTVASNRIATVYLFHADWCSYCHQQMPVLAAVDREYGSSVSVRYIDTEDPNNAALKAQYGVRGIPHMAFLNESGSVVRTSIGFTPMTTLRNYINATLSS